MIYFWGIPEQNQRRIIQQLKAVSGVRFYRSCKAMKALIDRVNPLWTFENATIRYHEDDRRVECIVRSFDSMLGRVTGMWDEFQTEDIKFVRIPRLKFVPEFDVAKLRPHYKEELVRMKMESFDCVIFERKLREEDDT